MVEKIENVMGDVNGKTLAVLGLSFKPETDDMREAPSIRIVSELLSRGIFDIIGYDPKAKETAKKVFRKRIKYADSLEEALKDSECAILITEWDEFKSLTPDDFKNYMKSPNLLDGRRIYPFNEFNKEISFKAIGRQYEKKK